MHFESFFIQAMIYLAAAVIAVPVGKKLGIGSVLGYLVAGAVIGPSVLGLIGGENGEDVLHFAEFGVVMMLFLIGLELRPLALWKMRRNLLGTGMTQVVVTTLAIGALAMWGLGESWRAALCLGLVLALSSTAIAIQTLTEKGLIRTRGGRHSFSVLLFQDIAVIPMIAVMPMLADPALRGSVENHSSTWTAHLPPWGVTLVVLLVVGGIVWVGRFAATHVLRVIAKTRSRETFVASALLLVVAITVLMTKIGLSPALGTFIAGVALSDNEYRHELESDLEPVKGLLLALFFMAIGAGIDFALIAGQPLRIIAMTAVLVAVKGLVLWGIGRVSKLSLDHRSVFTLALAQGGEFAFVLFAVAAPLGIISAQLKAEMTAVVVLSMALTPILFLAAERLLFPRFVGSGGDEREPDEIDEHNPVIIAGFGRFGNLVGRFLRAQDVHATVLDVDSDHIELLRKLGFKTYYGDASRLELLEAAGAESAKILVVAIGDESKATEIVQIAKRHFPHLTVLARAGSRMHVYELLEAGVDHFFLEQQGSAIDCAERLAVLLGNRAYSMHRAATQFKAHDNAMMTDLFEHRKDMKSYITKARKQIHDIEARFRSDRQSMDAFTDKAWESRSLIEEFGDGRVGREPEGK
ncbi:monovalent cation:proton antiporter-2 (CPA2) family protein [Sulfuriroseicoccus oceanibius]|uniref:Cation:proton antiporter n=1 Tax=Sulfuriroseicoccus oceanibius TaxID=2707525 RepID=A0A6B3LD78_9BACT|nr:monovalent cation:proton antiporter-2 (CPA2) family protein [Sulfuriroseicoccus oceanibius]QQL45389.1 cation:proton antiporter [Sulfuriroseicoccus oceanibius]